MDISNLYLKDTPILAHIGREKDETLLEHSDLVMSFFEKLRIENGLGESISNILDDIQYQGEFLNSLEKNLIEKWFYQAVYLHDLGKINPAFQKIKMRNNIEINLGFATDTKHSLLSSILYLDLFEKDIEEINIDDEEKEAFLRYILLLFSYVISRHHTYLQDISLEEYTNSLDAIFDNNLKKHNIYLKFYQNAESFIAEFSVETFKGYGIDSENHSEMPMYILMKLLYSTIVASDFYATYTYHKDGSKPNFRYFTEKDKKKITKSYEETKILQGIRAYDRNSKHFSVNSINKLRSDIFLEAEREILKEPNKSVYYLEAPTGSGKTNTSINLSLKLLQENETLNKIIYVFPFNTLMEQTKETFDNIFPDVLQRQYPMAVVNSVTPIVRINEKNESKAEDIGFDHSNPTVTAKKTNYSFIDYKEEVLYRQMLQYPITFTSHVNLFNYFYGTGREANLAFAHLCNSVIILDEIQGYRNERWIEIIRFIKKFAELLNIRFIIMSATLPRLDSLLEVPADFCELLPNKDKYFSHPIFKNRVQIHFDYIHEKIVDEEQLFNIVRLIEGRHGRRRILIQFINKKSAYKFYKYMLEFREASQQVILLTGDHHSFYRNKVISEIKNKDDNGEFKLDHVIVIATQVIEAGVDIDMDIGLKDISVLDSEEQFMGRINRSCLRADSHVYFFNKDKTDQIYKQDFRLQSDLSNELYQGFLKEKNFESFYEIVFDAMIKRRNQFDDQNLGKFNEIIHNLQFGKVAEHMRLINQKNYQLFVAHEIELEDGICLDGATVWRNYKELLFDRQMDYSERRIKLSNINEQMNYFIYQLYSEPLRREENIGNLYYVENGEEFLELDEFTGMMMFSSEKYTNSSEGLML